MRHRTDIQGLRGVAVLVVVLNHSGVGFLGGGYIGVDVFFVLSGYLITGLLLSEAMRDGEVSLVGFYVRRARRILPAATLTLVATNVAAYLLLNFVRAREVMVDSIWSALFVANIHFARVGTDYFAQWQPHSPLQHFWTLAVEEQFYLVWPAVLSVALLGRLTLVRSNRARAERRPPNRRALDRLLVVCAAATVLSFAWSVHSTRVSATDAYFSTFTRAWELGVGALLAILGATGTGLLERARSAPTLVGWLGLGAIATAAVAYSDRTLFPGYAALLPVAGTGAVIATGSTQTARLEAGRLLSSRPLTYVGDRSYALYLWHWPFLIVATEYEGEELSTTSKLLLACLAMLASIVSYRGFENPLRRLRWPVPGGIVMWPASVAAVVGVAVLAMASLDGRSAKAATGPAPIALADPSAVKSAAAVSAPLPAVVAAVKAAQRNAPLPKPLVPAIGSLLNDGYYFPPGCSPGPKQTKSTVCKLGAAAATKTLVVLGDSFAQHWMPDILAMAERDGWVVVPLVNGSGCAASAWRGDPKRPWCAAWYRWALGQAKALHPDVTFISGEWASDSPPAAATNATSLIAAAGKFSRTVIVMGVPPLQAKQPVDCLLHRGATTKSCTTVIPSAEASPNDTLIAAYAKKAHVPFVSPLAWFCARPSSSSPAYWCPLVINRTITRLDVGHISKTYAKELAAPFRGAFRRALFS
jgi:peptidoglycan/LPS O-acetylase OafA/YrhL